MTTVFLGTELKLRISIEPIDSMTMDDYDFEVEVWTIPNRVVRIPKENIVGEDAESRLVLVDTKSTGAGDLKCKITAYIPDGDFPDDLRTEVVVMDTGIRVIKS